MHRDGEQRPPDRRGKVHDHRRAIGEWELSGRDIPTKDLHYYQSHRDGQPIWLDADVHGQPAPGDHHH